MATKEMEWQRRRGSGMGIEPELTQARMAHVEAGQEIGTRHTWVAQKVNCCGIAPKRAVDENGYTALKNTKRSL